MFSCDSCCRGLQSIPGFSWHPHNCHRYKQIELPVKVLDHFLWSNENNINQSVCQLPAQRQQGTGNSHSKEVHRQERSGVPSVKVVLRFNSCPYPDVGLRGSPCNNMSCPTWQNKWAHITGVNVDTGAPLQPNTSGPPPSHTPCTYNWVGLRREQSKIVLYLFQTLVVKTPLVTWPGVVVVLTL